MPRDFRAYLEDILVAIGRIQDYTAAMSRENFEADLKTQDAVIRNLEIIGEAVRYIPQAIRQQSVSIDWRKIAGFRDVLIHQYFGVDLDIVWDAITRKLDDLAREIRKLIA